MSHAIATRALARAYARIMRTRARTRGMLCASKSEKNYRLDTYLDKKRQQRMFGYVVWTSRLQNYRKIQYEMAQNYECF